MPVDHRLIIALAGVRAARGELYRAAGLLRDAIRVAAGQGVSVEQLARAAGTSVDHVQRITTELNGPDGRRSGGQADRDGGDSAC